MISRRSLGLAALAGLSFPLWAKEATYVSLERPFENAAKTLIKIFSYDCPFCYRYDKSIDPWLCEEILPNLGLRFVPVFLESRAKYGQTAVMFLALCEREDEKNGRPLSDKASLFSQAKEALYFAYLKQKERWAGGEDAFLKTLTDATGLTKDFFLKRKADSDVLSLVKAWRPSKDIAAIQGIPAYVVNGRFLVRNTAARSKTDFGNIIQELSALP